MRFGSETEAVTYIFHSLRKLRGVDRGFDENSRDTAPTAQLLQAAGLLITAREYAVVTGSKGKGSTTVITAKLLQHLGHTVGMMTSPHLVTWRERIRVNGRAIPEADFLRILSDLAPEIDKIEAGLSATQYFSPQGIFLALALAWFGEQNVNAMVLEVGRGGRFDDIAVVPNQLSIFTPIMLEHLNYLGPTLARIAWHKAGIIKPFSYAYSVSQAPEVLDVLQTEAEAKNAEFVWIAPLDMGQYVGSGPEGMRMLLGRYGEVTVSLLGRYQVTNATLAVQSAGNIHARLPGVAHGSQEYVERIRAGLSEVIWPGRCQKLQDGPVVFIDGAINAESAQIFVESVRDSLGDPVISVIGVPDDKDYAGVYEVMAQVSQQLILTETARNPSLRFLPPEYALSAARRYHAVVSYSRTLAEAVDRAIKQAGPEGSVLIVGTQSLLADAMAIWGYSYEQI